MLGVMITTLEELYRGFEKEQLVPLWTEIGDLMPVSPLSAAVPHLWRWEQLRVLAAQAGELVPVGRGGSAGLSRWPTLGSAAGRSRRRRCGPRSST